MRIGRWIAIGAAVLLPLAGCGSSDPDVSEPAGRLLHAQVAAIRAAARSMDRPAASQQLVSLRSSVTRLRATGDLSREAAARIRRAADEVEGELTLIPLPTTTTTTTTAPPDRGKRSWWDHHQKEKKPGKHESDD